MVRQCSRLDGPLDREVNSIKKSQNLRSGFFLPFWLMFIKARNLHTKCSKSVEFNSNKDVVYRFKQHQALCITGSELLLLNEIIEGFI